MGNRWGNSGNSVRLYSLGLQSHCRRWLQSWNYKRHLLPGRKVITNLDSILKSRDITLPTKIRLVKPMVFPAVMYGCESWTVEKAECWRIDVVLEKTLESPLGCKEIQPVHSEGDQPWDLEGMMLKLKLQYFGYLMWRVDSLEKTLETLSFPYQPNSFPFL